MKRVELLAAILSRTARAAVGASTVRGRGNAGVVEASRHYLRELDLRRFGSGPAAFGGTLNACTEELRDSLPLAGRSWGLARKVVNIFLRDCLYNRYVCAAFELELLEVAMEIPLDSLVATGLRGRTSGVVLPRWTGVRHLTPAASEVYQAAALAEASAMGVARVHLDAVWWSLGRD